MILLVNWLEDNTTEFVLEVEDEYRVKLIKHIKKLENEFYNLKEEEKKIKGMFITDYIYEKLNDQNLCAELHYDFAIWDLVNVG